MAAGKPLILCVDDDADFLESISVILKQNGYQVATAGGVSDGLAAYKKARPDLVLVDLMMEEADAGLQLVKKLKALGPMPPTYLFSSAGEGLSRTEDYSALGLDGVLQKPISPETLLPLLGKLGRRQ